MQNETKPSNVVSLLAARRKEADQKEAKKETEKDESAAEMDFSMVMLKNKKTEEKLRRDRAKSNRSVLRSFRIK